MLSEIEKKIIIRKILFSFFLILTVILLVSAILTGIANKDDIINTMALAFGVPCAFTLTITIILGANFRRLAKERNL